MSKFSTSVAAISASVALGATLAIAAPSQAQAAGCNTNLSSFSTLKQGSKGTKARSAECLVRAAGYKTSINGSISSGDKAAIKKFQSSRGIAKTGTVARQTWTALVARGPKSYLSYNKRGASVVRLQRALTASGHKVSDTGWFGPQTRAALKSYQRAVGLKATGNANAATWRALQKGKVGKATAKKSTPKKSTKKKATSTVKASSRAGRAVSFARKQIGDPYRYGATGPNAWDCSGLTRGAWKAAGVSIPRTSQAQYRGLKKVSKSKLRAGDLVLFYSGRSHVGIYVGHGQVVHASRPGKPVSKIKMSYMPYAGAVRPA